MRKFVLLLSLTCLPCCQRSCRVGLEGWWDVSVSHRLIAVRCEEYGVQGGGKEFLNPGEVVEVDAQRTCLAWGWRWHVGGTFGSGFWRVRAVGEELKCDGAEGVDFDGLGVVVKENVDAADRGAEDLARVARVWRGGPAEGKIASLPQVDERCLGGLEERLGGCVPGEVE